MFGAGHPDPNAFNVNDLVLVKFMPPNTPPIRYVGGVTGRPYRFGSDGDSIQYVHKADAQLLCLRQEFEYVNADGSVAGM